MRSHSTSETRPLRRPWSPQTKWTVSMILLAFGVYLLFRFSEVIPPLILAVVLAYVLSPVVEWLHRHTGLGRGWATALTYLTLILLIAALFAVVVPLLVDQVTTLNLNLQQLLDQGTRWINHLVIFGHPVNNALLTTQVESALRGAVSLILGQGITVAMGVLTTLAWVSFVLVISFYLVKDGPQLRAYLEGLAPPAYRADYIMLRDEIGAVWAAFFRGQVVLAGVVTVIITAVAFIIGLPGALPMGLLAGVLEFLPSIGHGIWLSIAATLAFFLGSTWWPMPNWAFALLVIGLHVLFDQLDTNYLIPRIIGRRMHLHPLVVILGIVGGALMGGVLGIALAAPTIASLRVLGRYIYANLVDTDPFPQPISEPLPAPDPRWWQKPPAMWRRVLSQLRRRAPHG